MLKLLRLVLASLLLAFPAHAQTSRPITLTAADLRPSQSLDGAWHWSVDPYRDGLSGFHGGAVGSSSNRYADIVQADVARDNPGALFEFDMQRSPVTFLPAAWIGHSAEMRYYNGLVWYQRTFTTPALAPGKRAILRFGAVDYAASVYVNGKLAGKHVGGFTPFALDVTGLLRAGTNQITVGVDSERTNVDVPPPVTDWENYGGITRSVLLVTVPETFVDDGWVRLGTDGRITAGIRLTGSAAKDAPVKVRIAALGVTIEGKTDAEGQWTGSIAAPRKLERWSPESPKLYDVTFEGGSDAFTDRVGFRTIEVKGEDILLNGKSLFLRGICLHEEELGANPVRAITPASARALLEEVKTGLNGNFVRLAHYPHSEAMTRMADQLGLLVWSEIPVYWRVDWSNAETLANARNMLRENVERDRNRASVILWSVANETPITDARTAFLRTLIADVRALDPSRLVTAALLAGREGNVQTIDDPLAGDLDVMAVNTYNGWYSGDPLANVAAIEWKSPVRKPLIFSEFGADAQYGYRDDAAKPHKFSEEFQAEYYRQTLAMARKVPFLRGMAPWILKDFRSPRRQHPVHQQGWNRKGLLSNTGQRKQAFFVLAEDYARRRDGR